MSLANGKNFTRIHRTVSIERLRRGGGRGNDGFTRPRRVFLARAECPRYFIFPVVNARAMCFAVRDVGCEFRETFERYRGNIRTTVIRVMPIGANQRTRAPIYHGVAIRDRTKSAASTKFRQRIGRNQNINVRRDIM